MKSFSLLRRRLGGSAIAIWFAAMVFLGAGLLAKHLVAMPQAQSPRLGPAVAQLRATPEQGRWLAVHVLYSDCRCSRAVADHLATTQRPAEWSEIVLWVGADAPPAALEKNFDLRRVTATQLAAYGIEAAPSLVLADPSGQIRYFGGYTDRKQGPVVEDLRMMRAIQASQTVVPLPLFGCAVSARLKKDLSALPTL